MFVQVNKMIYREVPLPYSVDRQWFSVCANVNHRTLELYLNGEPLLYGADKDIFAVQGLFKSKYLHCSSLFTIFI